MVHCFCLHYKRIQFPPSIQFPVSNKMDLKMFSVLLLVVVAGVFAGEEPSLKGALEAALNVDSVDIAPEHGKVKREAPKDMDDLESLLDGPPTVHVVKRAAGSPDEFVSYGNSLDEAKANALKMAKEMFGEEQRVRFK